MGLKEKMVSGYTSLKCACLLAVWSVYIVYHAVLKPKTARQKINDITVNGSKKILDILKTTYSVSYPFNANQLQLEKNKCYIFMCNHLSLVDLPLIYATLNKILRPIAKVELFNAPIMGHAIRVSECIPVYRSDSSKRFEFMAYAKEKLMSGISLLVFPEGTRSPDGKLQPFKSGSFYLAKETNAVIIPMGVVNTNAVLSKKGFFVSFGKTIALLVGEPIETAERTPQELKQLVHEKIQALIS